LSQIFTLHATIIPLIALASKKLMQKLINDSWLYY
jgi:hypothetical protein